MITTKTVEEYDRRMLDDKMNRLTEKLESHIITDAEQYKDLKELVKSNSDDIKNLTNIWTQTKGAVTFIKILVSIVATITGIWAFLNSHITFKG